MRIEVENIRHIQVEEDKANMRLLLFGDGDDVIQVRLPLTPDDLRSWAWQLEMSAQLLRDYAKWVENPPGPKQ